jgi:hypothetical protein
MIIETSTGRRLVDAGDFQLIGAEDAADLAAT